MAAHPDPLPQPPANPPADLAEKPSAPRAWWLALRPKTLPLSLAPVLVGSLLASAEHGPLPLWPAFVAAAAALLIQIATNLANDAGDFVRGVDTPGRLGPPRATAMGWLPASAVRRVARAAFAAAFLLGVPLVVRGGAAIVAIGLASLLAGWAYTEGPRPIAWTPLGEVFVIVFFGFAAVGGSYYLRALTLSPAALLAGAMLGAFAAAAISVNNTRDIPTDAGAGKRTLAVRIGRQPMNLVYIAEIVLPYLLLPALAVLLGRGAWFALPCLSAGIALRLCRRFAASEGRAFNDLLAATARLQAFFAALLAVALVLSGVAFPA